MLPDFLIIGAQKSGTTWLDSVLRAHPDVYMPSLRKEVHFFDANYEKGEEWYSRYFIDATWSQSRVGEATPMYLFDPQVPSRIFATIPTAQLIATLRNPVERAVSHYRHAQARRAFTGSFNDFVEYDESVISRGMYSQQLTRYLDLWPKEAILVLIFEEATSDFENLKRRVASFLDIDAGAFGSAPPNLARAQRPLLRRTRAMATKVTSRVQSPVFDRLVGFARSLEVERAFGGQAFIEATPDERAMLSNLFAPEIERVEQLLDVDLEAWRTP